MGLAERAKYRPARGSRFVDRRGKKYGMLTAIKLHGWHNQFCAWKCLCDCGRYKIVWGTAFYRDPKHLHCGCQRRRKLPTSVWNTWKSNWDILCPEWRASARTFYQECMIKREGLGKEMSLNRLDETKPLGPGNFVFRRRGPLVDNGHGEKHTRSEWAEILGISRQRIDQRIKKYGLEVAVSYSRLSAGEFATVHGELVGGFRGKNNEPSAGGGWRAPVTASHAERAEYRKEALQMLVNGSSTGEVARHFGKSRAWAYRIAWKAGLKLRWAGQTA